MSPTIQMVIVIAVYLVSVLMVGFAYMKKNESASDFYLGGRSLGPLVTAMSAEASDMSAYLLVGLPGLAYLCGLAEVSWTIIGLAAGTYFNWLFTAKRLRRYTQITDSYTVPQFFSNRFHDKKAILTAISAVVIIVFFIPYTGSGFAACGKLFSTLFEIDYITAMIISAAVIVAYTAAGGFLAASVTDFIQSIIMTAALVFVVIFATVKAGGVSAVVENAKQLNGYFTLFASHVEDGNGVTEFGALAIVSTLAWGLGYFGMPHILLRFMAIEDEKKLKTSRRVASVWVVIAMAIAVVIGVVGRTLSSNGTIAQLFGEGQSETLMTVIARYLSTLGVLPTIMGGLILAGILASTMSTADSQLLATSSSVSQNLIQETFHLKISEKKSMLIARITVIVIAILGVVIARNPNSSVFKIVSFAWAGFGAAFGPVMILALFWKKTTLSGAITGMVSGGAMVFIWKFLVRPNVKALDIYELLPAFVVAIVAIVVVSLLTQKTLDPEIEKEFELAKSKKEL